MPSVFDDLSAEIFRETSTEFGESFVHKPQRHRVNKSALPDPDRPVICFTGQMRQPWHGEHMSRGRQQYRPDISTSEPSVLALVCDFPAGVPRQDDLVERVEPYTVYDVGDVRPDGRGRVRLTLLERGVRSLG